MTISPGSIWRLKFERIGWEGRKGYENELLRERYGGRQVLLDSELRVSSVERLRREEPPLVLESGCLRE